MNDQSFKGAVVEALVFFILLGILVLKIYAIINIQQIRKSFIVASISEILYLGLGVLGAYALGAAVLHIEYQLIFRILALLFIFELTSIKGKTLEDIKGTLFNWGGVFFGLAIFGALGIDLIGTRGMFFNVLSKHSMFEMGYLLIAVSILEAYYLISVFENVVFCKKEIKEKVYLKNKIFIGIFSFLGILALVFPYVYFIIPSFIYKIAPHYPHFSLNFHGIRGFFALIFGFIGVVVLFYSFDYIHKYKKFYYSALIVMIISMIELPLNATFEGFHFLWEAMTVSSYLLIMHSRTQKSIGAAKLYLLMCIAGAFFLQMAFSGFYVQNIDSFAQISTVSLTLALLLLIGFGVKAGIVPLHEWLPVAHPEAPSSISAPLSGILTKAGIFGLVAVIYLFGFKNIIFSYVLITLGLVTLLYGEIKTLYENDIKRLFAYSTIGQIGEIVTILGLMTPLALTGALYHVLNHAVVKDLLFLSAGVLIVSSKSRNLQDLQGIGKALPIAAFPLGVGLFAISALPPFGNFNSKFLMIDAAVKSNNYIAAFGLIIGAVIGFIAMLRVFRIIFLLNPKRKFENVGGIKLLTTYVLAFVSFILGIMPSKVISFITQAIHYSLNISVNTPQFVLHIPYSIEIIILGAFIVFFFGRSSISAGLIAAFVSFVAFVVELFEKFSIHTAFAELVLFMAVLNFLYAARYMDHSHKPYRFFANFLIMIAGILGVALNSDIYSMFFYWEIMGGWALYIALVHEEDSYSLREATKYLIYNYAGAGILMIGLSMVLQHGNYFFSLHTMPLDKTTFFAVLLLTIGFLAKAAQFPVRIDFQMHPKPAPTPISGYISSVMLKTGPFMLVILFYLFAAAYSASRLLYIQDIAHFAAIVGVITIIMGAAFGLLTNSMKRLLIFLTVAEIGYIIAGVSLLTGEGLAAGLLHLVNHMFFKDLLFLSAGAIFYKTGIDSLDELGGIARKMPITFGVFMIAVFSTAGVPMFSGFVSKWMIYHALMAKGYVFLAVLTLLGSVMILLVFVKFMHSAYFGKMDEKLERIEKVDFFMAVPMILLALLNIILGIFPYIALKPIDLIVEKFGFAPVCLTPTSVCMGGDKLNLAYLAFYLLIALLVGFLLYLYNKKTRKTHIFLSGVRDLSKKELHIKSSSFYESVTDLINKIIIIVKRVFGMKGGYVER